MSRLGGGLGAVAVLAGVFVGGALTGAAGMKMWAPDQAPTSEERVDRPDRRQRDGGRRSHRGSGDRFLKSLSKRLELDQEQEAAISALLASSRSVSDSLYGSIEPTVRQHLEQTRNKIRELLTDEQREQFDSMVRSQRRRGSSRDSNRGSDGPRP